MKIKTNIFEILVAVTFLTGQVQYIRTIYYCTEQLRAVNRPSAEMHSSKPMLDNEICDECQGFIPFYHEQTLSRTNCIQVHTLSKSSVSNFTIADKSISNLSGIVGMQNELSSVIYRPPAVSCTLTNHNSSPPSDIPVVNSNLRI